jgi:hypothetical protein
MLESGTSISSGVSQSVGEDMSITVPFGRPEEADVAVGAIPDL